MNNIDFKPLFKQFLVRLSFVIILCFVMYLCKQSEMVRTFQNYETKDIGSLIMLIGILMGASCFFSSAQPIAPLKLFNIACSTAICTFGFALYEHGIFTAIWITGICICVAAYLLAPLCLRSAGTLMLVGIVIMVISYPLRSLDCPTKILPQSTRLVDIETRWQLFLCDSDGYKIELPSNTSFSTVSKFRNLNYTVKNYTPYTYGTEESIIKNATKLLNELIKNNPNQELDHIQISCMEIPQNYHDKYGYPDVYYFYKNIYAIGKIDAINHY